MLTTLKETSRVLDSKMFARDEHLFLSHENISTSFEISNSKRIRVIHYVALMNTTFDDIEDRFS